MFKKLATLALTTVLVTSGFTAAKADPVQLSLNEFKATPGYALLTSEATATTNYLATVQGLKIDTALTATVLGQTAANISQVLEVSGGVSRTTTSISSSGSVSGPFVAVITADTAYVPKAMALNMPDVINVDAAIKRLGKTAATVIAAPVTVDSGLANYKASAITGGATLDALNVLGDSTFNTGLDLSTATFTEPVATPNVDDPSATDYSYSITTPAAAAIPSMVWNVVTTYSSAHIFIKNTMSIDLGLIAENVVTTLQVDNSLSISAPPAASTVAYSALVSMGRKIQAENSLASKAALIVKKAGKTVTGAKLVLAAKSLKYAYSAVKNGIKLTAKFKGVSGGMCVTAVKGKAVTNHC